MSIKRVKRDATEWAIVNNRGTINTFPFANYDPHGKRDWGDRRHFAYKAAFQAFLGWVDQPCMEGLNLQLIER